MSLFKHMYDAWCTCKVSIYKCLDWQRKNILTLNEQHLLQSTEPNFKVLNRSDLVARLS